MTILYWSCPILGNEDETTTYATLLSDTLELLPTQNHIRPVIGSNIAAI